MKLSALRTNADLVREESATDPVFKAQWAESLNHRRLAILMLEFRSENELSQADLADMMGLPVSAVERIERGDVGDPA